MKTRKRRLSRPYLTVTLLTALSAVLGAAVLRAAAQSVMAQPPDTTPGAPSKPAPASTPPAIRDDPTVAPDRGQSADNNVSFPVDI